MSAEPTTSTTHFDQDEAKAYAEVLMKALGAIPAEPAEEQVWRPIKTAPTDGTWVLLTGGDTEYRWDGETKPPAVVGQFAHWLNGEVRDEPVWQFAYYDGGYMGEYENPTHWRPLPAPPIPSPPDGSTLPR